MVAFVASVVVSALLFGAAFLAMQRRPADRVTTWGEAMLGATFIFLTLFWVFGVVPHQWLAWADNELGWRKDKILAGPASVADKSLSLDIPITISYEHIRDVLAAGIYIVALGVQIALWSMWQNRGKSKPKEIETSAFGRPLVKAGSNS